MKNLKSPLIVLGCVLVLTVTGCRSGNNPPANGSTVILTLTKARAAIPGGGFYDGLVQFSVTPGVVDSTCPVGTDRCEPSYPVGSVVTLTVPAGGVPVGHSFNGWNIPTCGNSSTCEVTLGSNFAVQAFFGPVPPTVGDIVVLTPTAKLVSFNYSDPELTRTSQNITGLDTANGETVVGIDYQPTLLTNSNPLLSRLIAVTRVAAGPNAPGRLVEITPSTGNITTAPGALFPPRVLTAAAGDSFTGLVGTQFGVDYNPDTRVLRVVSDSGQNLSIEVGQNVTATGTPIPGGTVTTNGTLSEGGGITATGITGAAYTNNYFNPRATLLYTINRLNRRLYVQNNTTGLLHEIATVTTPTSAPSNISDFDIRGGGVDITGRDVATAADAVYVSDATGGAGTGASLYHLNLRDGSSTLISGPVISGQIPVPLNGANVNPLSEGVRSLAIRPIPAPVLGDVLAINDRNELISFNRNAPSVVLSRNAIPRLYSPTTRPVADNLVGFDLRPSNGLLYGVSRQGRLYTINPDSGLGSLVGSLGVALTGTDHGVDFNPVNGLLRVVSDTGQNLVLNPDSVPGGVVATTAQPRLFRGSPPGTGANLTASAYSNNLPVAAKTVLYGIDTTNSTNAVLATQNITAGSANLGQVSNVGSLGVGAEGGNGFDIDGRTGTAYAALRVGGVARLYRIDLSSGAATGATNSGSTPGTTAADNIGSGAEFLVGLSLRPPLVRAYGLVESAAASGILVEFDPASPSVAPLFALPVTGLVGGTAEKLVDVDYRADDDSNPTTTRRALFGISNQGRVYTLTLQPNATAPTSVTVSSATAMFANGGTPPFSTLAGSLHFGSDFRPIVGGASPILHVAAAAEGAGNPAQNLKVTVSNGGTQRDANLSVNNQGIPIPLPGFADDCDDSAAPRVGGLAYSNSTTTETLYMINENTECLYTVDSVSGSMTAVNNPLFSTASGFSLASPKMGFEITGPTDGQVLAAFDLGAGDTRSTLFTIDLATGAATQLGPVGVAGTTGKLISVTTSFKAFNDLVGP